MTADRPGPLGLETAAYSTVPSRIGTATPRSTETENRAPTHHPPAIGPPSVAPSSHERRPGQEVYPAKTMSSAPCSLPFDISCWSSRCAPGPAKPVEIGNLMSRIFQQE